MLDFKGKTLIICGHYGSGKTTVALNLALAAADRGMSTSIIDMDIVNPYFRTTDFGQMLSCKGIDVIIPTLAGTTLDVPSLSPRIEGALTGGGDVVLIDVGGDDAGATALRAYSDTIKSVGYEMLYVINARRPEIADAEHAEKIAAEIESACALKISGIINNTHLCGETTESVIEASKAYAADVANRMGVPLVVTSFDRRLSPSVEAPLPIDIVVVPPWM